MFVYLFGFNTKKYKIFSEKIKMQLEQALFFVCLSYIFNFLKNRFVQFLNTVVESIEHIQNCLRNFSL